MNYYVFSILYMAIFGYFGHMAKIKISTNIALIILSGIVVNIPFNGLSITMLTYSFVGEMSVFLFTLSLMSIFESLRVSSRTLMNLKAFIFIFIFGLILYLSVLNILPFDLYYQPREITIIIGCAITILAYFIHKPLGFIYLISLFAYGLGVLSSKNIFDYLIDVPTWVFSMMGIVGFGIKRLVKRR
ncbi:hypothetical protein [Helicobacter sp. 11S02596-1]|uniref:hypothetical protein n=1 Tax=Helicobacter sp. 11S02596-1 TaxID=1476194 RepID=UPI000BA6D539|nr:hypothetical protein [Helicobacter sp. 11S02596-1]PAF45140.1 hypothetical protein BJI48_00810 [Helicobacter sp. 11S02596-1]